MPRKITVPEGGQLLEPIVVKKHHLDTNHHVNNGQYVNIAMEHLPDGFAIRRMRAEYKKQAFLLNLSKKQSLFPQHFVHIKDNL